VAARSRRSAFTTSRWRACRPPSPPTGTISATPTATRPGSRTAPPRRSARARRMSAVSRSPTWRSAAWATRLAPFLAWPKPPSGRSRSSGCACSRMTRQPGPHNR